MTSPTLLAPHGPAVSGRSAPGRLGQMIAVASGKGGVGKTWFSVTLAHALTRAGARVLLVDWDLGLANLDVQLGLAPQTDLATVLRDRRPLADAVLHHQVGFDILAGSSGTGAISALDAGGLAYMLTATRGLAEQYDYVICDLAAGIDPTVRRMAAFADLLLVVVTDEPTSLTDAYAVLKLHRQDAPSPTRPARIVVNRASSPSSGSRTYTTLARACQSFLGQTPALAGIIRRDDRVADAIRRQTPFLGRHPTSAAAADVEAVARAVLQGG